MTATCKNWIFKRSTLDESTLHDRVQFRHTSGISFSQFYYGEQPFHAYARFTQKMRNDIPACVSAKITVWRVSFIFPLLYLFSWRTENAPGDAALYATWPPLCPLEFQYFHWAQLLLYVLFEIVDWRIEIWDMIEEIDESKNRVNVMKNIPMYKSELIFFENTYRFIIW